MKGQLNKMSHSSFTKISLLLLLASCQSLPSTSQPSAQPTTQASASPSAGTSPTASQIPTPSPTASVAPSPAPSVSATPYPQASVKPTPSPTPRPTPKATPTPTPNLGPVTTISGQVLSAQGESLSGVIIQLVRVDGGNPYSTATLSSFGYFHFQNIPTNGVYALSATLSGYLPAQTQAATPDSVPPGQRTVNLQLIKDSTQTN
jgi:hypothetical protein